VINSEEFNPLVLFLFGSLPDRREASRYTRRLSVGYHVLLPIRQELTSLHNFTMKEFCDTKLSPQAVRFEHVKVVEERVGEFEDESKRFVDLIILRALHCLSSLKSVASLFFPSSRAKTREYAKWRSAAGRSSAVQDRYSRTARCWLIQGATLEISTNIFFSMRLVEARLIPTGIPIIYKTLSFDIHRFHSWHMSPGFLCECPKSEQSLFDGNVQLDVERIATTYLFLFFLIGQLRSYSLDFPLSCLLLALFILAGLAGNMGLNRNISNSSYFPGSTPWTEMKLYG
jgi:hypothetical protein